MSEKPRAESPFKAFQRMRQSHRQESPIRQTIQEDQALVDSEDRDPSPPINRPALDQSNPFNDSTPSMKEAIRASQRKQRESSTNPFDGNSSVASSDVDSGAISPRSSFKKRKMAEEAAKELEGLDVEMDVVKDLPSSTGGIGFLASKGSDLEDKSEHDGELETLLMASQKQPVVEDGKVNFLEDKKSTMTVGRRIALSLMKHEWYYPKSKAQEEIDPSVLTLEERKTLKSSISAAKQEAYPFTIAQLAKPSLEDAWACKSNEEADNLCRKLVIESCLLKSHANTNLTSSSMNRIFTTETTFKCHHRQISRYPQSCLFVNESNLHHRNDIELPPSTTTQSKTATTQTLSILHFHATFETRLQERRRKRKLKRRKRTTI